MSRGRILISILISISLMAPANVYANGINRTVCKTKGALKNYNKKIYICSKSGKKLIWIEKISAQKSETKPIANPNAEVEVPYNPWSVPSSTLQISNEAKKKFGQWLNLQSKSNNLEVAIDPAIKRENVEYLISVVKLASETLLGAKAEKPHLYIAAGDDWVIEKIKSEYPIHSGFSGKNICYAPNPFAACAWPNFGFMFFVSKSSEYWNVQNQGVVASGAHEFFHLAQAELSRNSKNEYISDTLAKLPAWFFEGSASFFGTAYADASGNSTWNSIRKDEIFAYNDGRGRNEPISSFMTNELDRPQPEAQSHRPYGIGFLACELIIASIGVDRFLSIYRNLGLGQSFEAAFKNSTGLDIQDFYVKFDSMRKDIGFFPVIKS